jgi:ketosteroid isomerase-like protein
MSDPLAVLDKLIDATNRHDLDAIVATFAEDVVSETPAHPVRSFTGSDQIRRNWSQILGSVVDFHAAIVAAATSPSSRPGAASVWAELAFDGTRPDGVPFRLRGVTVNEVVGDRIASLRFYLEPVDAGGVTADEAVRAAVGAAARAGATPAAGVE